MKQVLLIVLILCPLLQSCATFGEGKRTIQVVESKTGIPLSGRKIAWRSSSFIPHFPIPQSPLFLSLDKSGMVTDTLSFSDGFFYLGPFDPEGGCITDTSAMVSRSLVRSGGEAPLRSFKLGADGLTTASPSGEILMNSRYKLIITKKENKAEKLTPHCS